ncbi:hypothetical protein ES705_40833 [subsurface metagenome]
MAGYLIEDIEEYEHLYKATKERHLKHWYRYRLQLVLERIASLLNDCAKSMKGVGKLKDGINDKTS